MSRSPLTLIILVFCASSILPVYAAPHRTFTDKSGRELRGEVVELDDDKENVVLKINGRNYPVKMNDLSKGDQRYIKQWAIRAKRAFRPKANWDGPWPKSIAASVTQEIEILKEEDGHYIYASPHYEFHCNVKLNKSVVKRFALLFEATHKFCQELPLGMSKAFQEKRYKIVLCETMGQYYQMGGPRGSAGVYFGGRDVILVPLASLGVKKIGSAYSVDYKDENSTLSHEICHQLTDPEFFVPGSVGWFTEGLAEYISTSRYRSGKFNVDDISSLKSQVVGFGKDGSGGMGLGENIKMPRLQQWMQQSYSNFVRNSRFNYGTAALIVYYFFHMDGDKDAAHIRAFLKDLKRGEKGPEAFKSLLGERSFEQLEEEISKAWRGRGVKITFG